MEQTPGEMASSDTHTHGDASTASATGSATGGTGTGMPVLTHTGSTGAGGSGMGTGNTPKSSGSRPAGEEPASRPAKASETSRAGAAGGHLPLGLDKALSAPMVQNYIKAADAASQRSRFAIMRSEFMYPFTWHNPLLSGAAFFGWLAFMVSHGFLARSAVGMLSGLIVVSLLVSAAIAVHNSMQSNAASTIQLPRLNLNRPGLVHLATRVVDGIMSAVDRLNAQLSWSDSVSSARALAYAWLVMQHASWFHPATMYLLVLSMFFLVPAYILSRITFETAWDANIVPNAGKVASKMRGFEDQIGTLLRAQNRNTVAMGVAAGLVAFMYLFWDYISIAGLFSLAAYGVAIRDLIVAVAEPPRTHAE